MYRVVGSLEPDVDSARATVLLQVQGESTRAESMNPPFR
jgi:hypothetical protein